jgi:Asp-tRNA(Asn)/Glu-tRNA(Gln) amidotransferase B subunit
MSTLFTIHFFWARTLNPEESKKEENTMGTDKEAIKLALKDEFFSHFKKVDTKSGDTLSVTWLYDEFLPSLSKKEQLALEDAILEMIHDGLITYVHRPKITYALTQKGKDLLC